MIPFRQPNLPQSLLWLLLGSLLSVCACGDTTLGPAMPPDGGFDPDVGPPTPMDAALDAPIRDATGDRSTPPDASPDASPDSSVPPSTDCSARLICEDFESDTPGGAPATSRWEVLMPDCSGTGSLQIDGEIAASGRHSLRIDGQAGYCNHVFASPTTSLDSISHDLWVRFRVRFESALSRDHVTFLTMHDATDDREIRMGGQSEILMWNKELDDATLPELSPTGIAASVRPTAGAWHCVEYHVNGSAGTLDTYVDGSRVEGLSADGTPTRDLDGQWHRRPWSPSLTNALFGWESYGGAAMTLWFDDIVIDDSRIGCD